MAFKTCPMITCTQRPDQREFVAFPQLHEFFQLSSPLRLARRTDSMDSPVLQVSVQTACTLLAIIVKHLNLLPSDSKWRHSAQVPDRSWYQAATAGFCQRPVGVLVWVM
ncbi:hypothetical protein PT974_10601 [Cladobotryum mycophilum]|uniref:Uncharacterized protein n=1 Tax=Cladobotryum mycophilum TaxID=491253 RepID=A0ABR0SAB7_9HYPO